MCSSFLSASFLDSRTAFAFHTGMILIASLSLSFPYEFILLELIGGMVAVQTTREMTQRSQIVTTMIVIIVVQEIMHLAYELLSDSSFSWSSIERYEFIFIFIGGIMLLFAYPLLWVVEKFFGFTS